MSQNPEFFVKILSSIYLPLTNNQSEKEQEFEEDHKAIASQAFRLLNSWRLVPGENNLLIDGTTFENWIEQVRFLCKQSKYLELSALADQNIGRILAFSSAEPDGVWPSVPVRNIIKKFRNREFKKGVLYGIFEKRGVTSRTMTEGGSQEKVIASNYRQWAKEVRIKWPSVGALLRSIAEAFDRKAKRFDNDSEQTYWSQRC